MGTVPNSRKWGLSPFPPISWKPGLSPLRPEADSRVGAVAEWLGRAAPAPAQTRRFDARDDTAGAGDDLHVAADLQRSVGERCDFERTVAHGQHVGLARGRFAA